MALILKIPVTSNQTETPFFPYITQIHSMRNIKQQISNEILFLCSFNLFLPFK